MKTFDDLVFDIHPMWKSYPTIPDYHPNKQIPQQAKMEFENGYAISVISGWLIVGGGNEGFYEMMVFPDYGGFDDVIGPLTLEEVTEYMLKVQRKRKLK